MALLRAQAAEQAYVTHEREMRARSDWMSLAGLTVLWATTAVRHSRTRRVVSLMCGDVGVGGGAGVQAGRQADLCRLSCASSADCPRYVLGAGRARLLPTVGLQQHRQAVDASRIGIFSHGRDDSPRDLAVPGLHASPQHSHGTLLRVLVWMADHEGGDAGPVGGRGGLQCPAGHADDRERCQRPGAVARRAAAAARERRLPGAPVRVLSSRASGLVPAALSGR